MSRDRTGFTTGTCAAAASKAAIVVLCGLPAPDEVEVGLPYGARVRLPVEFAVSHPGFVEATVRKDAGDDPDVTDGCVVTARVEWAQDRGIRFVAGEGVGTVTKPGLAVPPGEPAINPTPRIMIRDAVREVTDRGLRITLAIPGGRELAEKTFNPRLGVLGGLSILGTSGIVRPFSTPALRDALKCALSVAVACKITCPVFVPGRIGRKAALKRFELEPEQVLEVGNEWAFVLDEAMKSDFDALLVLGHPGKLAKLPAGSWDTHSSRSSSPVPVVLKLAREILGRTPPESTTAEGVFSDLGEDQRRELADALAGRIREAVFRRVSGRFGVAVALVNMRGDLLGCDGDLSLWRRKTAS